MRCQAFLECIQGWRSHDEAGVTPSALRAVFTDLGRSDSWALACAASQVAALIVGTSSDTSPVAILPCIPADA